MQHCSLTLWICKRVVLALCRLDADVHRHPITYQCRNGLHGVVLTSCLRLPSSSSRALEHEHRRLSSATFDCNATLRPALHAFIAPPALA
jgi:hypothetical protein